MPVITIETWEGKSAEQKRKVIEAVTAAIVTHFDANPEKTIVVIHENSKDNWGHAGVQASSRTQ